MVFVVHPLALGLLAGIPLFIVWYLDRLHKNKQAALAFSRVGLMKSVAGNATLRRKQHVLCVFTVIVLVLLILALADLHVPLRHTKKGVSVVLIIDNSGSMRAGDYQPTRLDAAKRSADLLISSLHVSDHVGIVTFENGATTAAYLSPDKERAREKLQTIDHKDGRTALGDGLALGVDMAVSIPNKKKIAVLLSDGVNNAGAISPEEAIVFAQTHDVQVYTVGMGSTDPVVLARDFFGNPQYAELDEATLRTIATQTDGAYFKSVDTETLDTIYTTISDTIKREREETSVRGYLIALALICIGIQQWLRYGRHRIIQ